MWGGATQAMLFIVEERRRHRWRRAARHPQGWWRLRNATYLLRTTLAALNDPLQRSEAFRPGKARLEEASRISPLFIAANRIARGVANGLHEWGHIAAAE